MKSTASIENSICWGPAEREGAEFRCYGRVNVDGAQRPAEAGRRQVMVGLPAKPQMLHFIPKQWRKKFLTRDMIKSASYFTIHLIVIWKQRLPLEKTFKALEPGKVAVGKIKTQFLPRDLSTWEAGSDTVESRVSRVVGRPASDGWETE